VGLVTDYQDRQLDTAAEGLVAWRRRMEQQAEEVLEEVVLPNPLEQHLLVLAGMVS